MVIKMIQFENVLKNYSMDEIIVHALRDVSLLINKSFNQQSTPDGISPRAQR